jgi:hypothetical protein
MTSMDYELKLGNGHVAHLDLHDYMDLADFRWRWRPVRNTNKVQAARYITVNGKRRLSYLQNEIMQPPEGHEVIFLNHDRLDCRRSNLRVVTTEEARKHRRKGRTRRWPAGIRYIKREKLWVAELRREGVRRLIGKFRWQWEAILALIASEKADAKTAQ